MGDKVWNTNLLENGFADLLNLCGGCKPELVQVACALSRADFIEFMKHSAGRRWEMKRRDNVQKASGMYAEHGDADGKLAKCELWNNGLNLDPRCPSVRQFEAALRKVALANCTARVESMRSNFAGRGIGKDARASIASASM